MGEEITAQAQGRPPRSVRHRRRGAGGRTARCSSACTWCTAPCRRWPWTMWTSATPLLGKRCATRCWSPGMTGGTERAGKVNRDLAAARRARTAWPSAWAASAPWPSPPSAPRTYQVRDVAPTVVLIGNIGLYQAAQMGVDGVRRLADAIGADGMALHLNAGQELTQPEGDRDFRGGYAVVQALVQRLRRPAAGEGDRLRHLARGGAAAGRAAACATSTSPAWAAPPGCAWSSCAPRASLAEVGARVLRLGHSHRGGHRLRAPGRGPERAADRLGRHAHRAGGGQGARARRGLRRAWRCRCSAPSKRAAWRARDSGPAASSCRASPGAGAHREPQRARSCRRSPRGDHGELKDWLAAL